MRIIWEPTRFGCNNCDAIGVLVETRTGYCAECFKEVSA